MAEIGSLTYSVSKALRRWDYLRKLSKEIQTLINIQKWLKNLTPTCVKPMLGEVFYYVTITDS